MKKLEICLIILFSFLFIFITNIFAEDYLTLHEPGYTQEVIIDDLGTVRGELGACVDLDRNIYFVDRAHYPTPIGKISPEGIISIFATPDAMPDHSDTVENMAIDINEGALYVILDAYNTVTFEKTYPLIKISGFTTLSESGVVQNLQQQIDTIELIPGPQGPQGDPGPQGEQGIQGQQGPQGEPGITPEEVATMQSQIAMLEQQLQEQQEYIDRILSHPWFRFWFYPDAVIGPHPYPYGSRESQKGSE